MMISMGLSKKNVTPLLMHWSYVFLALTHQSDQHTSLDSNICNVHTVDKIGLP